MKGRGPVEGERFSIFDALDRLRSRAVAVEALAHAAASKAPISTATEEGRRVAERRAFLADQAHEQAADLLHEIKTTIARLLLDARPGTDRHLNHEKEEA